MNRNAHGLAVIAAVFLVTITAAVAKRAAAPVVAPVRVGAVEYRAPNNDGQRGYIQAWDHAATNKLWEVTVFTNSIDPNLEQDVQHTYINSLAVSGDAIVVTDEAGREFSVHQTTRKVSRKK